MADRDSRKGTTYATPELLGWLEKVHAPHDDALQRAFDAPAAHGMPAIQVAPAEGKLLELLVRIAGARRVVEVGTLAAYSTIRLARALPADGKLWTLELDPRHAAIARANVAAAKLGDRVTVLEGRALDLLPTLDAEGPFDLVFLDADKEGYADYGRWAAKALRPGGLLVADNSFYFGKLLDDTPAAASVRRFHEETARAFDSVCIPTPDGMVLGVRR